MPYRYPSEFRRKVLDLIASGRSVASVAADLGVSDQTIYTWRKQELVDTGVEAGLTTIEAAELRAAKRKIKDLESELAVTRRANELLKEQVVSPKGGLRRSR
ncbi:MAG: transposase [Acidobacteria bacterium]|nr:transposase [Acidobacteriota bacterium]